jgi:hypothetical protein
LTKLRAPFYDRFGIDTMSKLLVWRRVTPYTAELSKKKTLVFG